MVSDSCKKRFGKIMMEEMELVAQEEIAPPHLFYDLEGGNGGADATRSIPSYPSP